MPLVTRTSGNSTVFRSDTEPSDFTEGNIWIDTSVTPNVLYVANGTDYVIQGIAINDTVISLEKAIIALG